MLHRLLGALIACAALLGLAWLNLGPLRAAPGMLLFQDDFSDPTSGWALLDGPQGRVAYTAGALQIQVALPGVELWSALPAQYRFPADVQVDVTVQAQAGPAANWFGILCRYQDERNFYWAVISSDGYYGLGRMLDGQRSLLQGVQMPPSEGIARGLAANHLRLDCAGDRLRFYANGLLLQEGQDSSLRSGRVGLIAGLDPAAEIIAAGPLLVEFDHLTVLMGTP